MAMSGGKDDGSPMMDMNTTPLIDVMLVLLIMFIITIPIQTHAVKVDLPINSKTNKQAGTIKGADELTEDNANWFRDRIGAVYAEAQDVYEHALRCGVPKELARIHLPVGRYSRMRASANLRNWLGFLTLRMAPNAQWEIRQFANALHDMLAPLFPRTLALFDEKKQR